MNKRTALFTAMVAASSIAFAADADLYVGVLEAPPCKTDAAKAARVLFVKREEGWVSLEGFNAPEEGDLKNLAWTVAFDGRNLGSLRTTDSSLEKLTESDARDRFLALLPDQQVPIIADPEKAFAGWCGASPDRPLVIVSRPQFRDPDGWKSFRPGPDYKAKLFDSFKAAVGAAEKCIKEERRVPFAYRASDLVLHKSYRDKKGRALVHVQLNPAAYGCDGPPDPQWYGQWFLLSDSAPQHLGSGLTLLDAGDYDADGRSEVLFKYSGYNEDGYTMFFDDFLQYADYRWSYH